MTMRDENQLLDEMTGEPADLAQVDQGTEDPSAEQTASPAETGETPAEPEPKGGQEERKPGFVPTEALKAERKRRREAEKELAFLKGRESVRAKSEQGEEPEPSGPSLDWTDLPRSIQDIVKAELDAYRESQRVTQLDEQVAEAQKQHEDFDDLMEEFEGIARDNLAIRHELSRAKNPAQFVVDFMRTRKEIASHGSVDALREQIRNELMAEMQGQGPPSQPQRPRLPKTQAGARGAGKSAQSVSSDPGQAILDRLFPD